MNNHYQEQLESEKKYLHEVLHEISSQLTQANLLSKNIKTTLRETQKDMWDEVASVPNNLEDMDELVQAKTYLDEIKNQQIQYNLVGNKIDTLSRMQHSPYFGRIDFCEDSCETERIYIGIASLISADYTNFYVYDWRAPISSLFYDFENGRVQYDCPDGTIHGDLILKRQYRIINGKLELMFDCSLIIDDEILQDALSKNTGEKMQTIVTTIQRTQNQVIRDDTHSYILVSGPAGSGKTSVALHRIAWLLYRHRGNISSENILVLSPNEIFSDYISNVLPELGEANMRQMTYKQLSKRLLGENYIIGDFNEQMEDILSQSSAARKQSIIYKTSDDFYFMIKEYAAMLAESPIEFFDLYVGDKLVISKESIYELYTKDFSYLPIKKRLDKIRARLTEIVKRLILKNAEKIAVKLAETGNYANRDDLMQTAYRRAEGPFQRLMDSIKQSFSFQIMDYYISFFSDPNILDRLAKACNITLPSNIEAICSYTLAQLDNGLLNHEDCIALSLLKVLSGDAPKSDNIRHIVIDESQDYLPMQLHLVKEMFPDAGITFLGDPGQAVNPYINGSHSGDHEWNQFKEILNDGKLAHVKLRTGYRSTVEINSFCNEILDTNISNESINRHGGKPIMVHYETIEKCIETLAKRIISYEELGYHSIAVICINAIQTAAVHDLLRAYIPIKVITSQDSQFAPGNCVIPSYLAKGLEFDVVMVFDANAECYPDLTYKNLLYTVCSRALHRLEIFTSGKPSPILQGLDPSCFIEDYL